MALCSALISSRGPTTSDVPVSTMAWQLALHSVSWLPTSTLKCRLETRHNKRVRETDLLPSTQPLRLKGHGFTVISEAITVSHINTEWMKYENHVTQLQHRVRQAL